MTMKMALWSVAVGITLAAGDAAAAQDMHGMEPHMMQDGASQETTGQGMMQGGMGGARRDQGMQCMMMHGGMGSEMTGRHMGRGMMGFGMGEHMGGGMMGSGMMGSGMMGSGMQGGARSGMGALFGSRVRPVMNLSIDDVRGYLAFQIERLNNKRLKVGDVKDEGGTITADVVTVDNSLVQRLKVDRHTGSIQYEN